VSIVATRYAVSEFDELHRVALVGELLFGGLHDAFLCWERRSKLAVIAAMLYLVRMILLRPECRQQRESISLQLRQKCGSPWNAESIIVLDLPRKKAPVDDC
jgi:hypothetical protein